MRPSANNAVASDCQVPVRGVANFSLQPLNSTVSWLRNRSFHSFIKPFTEVAKRREVGGLRQGFGVVCGVQKHSGYGGRGRLLEDSLGVAKSKSAKEIGALLS